VLAGLALWVLEGIVLFSAMARLHPRYTEAFTPAVAGMLGVGIAWTTAKPTARRSALLVLSTLVVVLYAGHLLYGTPAIWWVTFAGAAGALLLAAIPRTRGAAFVPLLCCVLAIPLWASLNAVRENVSDANVLGSLPSSELDRLSGYLRAHKRAAHYEVAYDAATKMGALVMRDARPVLPLTMVEGRLLVAPARLRALASAGQVRYAFLPSPCPAGGAATNADCSVVAAWIRGHGTDVSGQAGLAPGTLWELPGAHRAR
jgi:hypothetical protein